MEGRKENRFDKEAVTWDEKPGRLIMAAEIADKIKAEIPLSREMKAMEFGSGTGLVSMRLVKDLKSLTAADTAEKMLEVLEEKAAKENIETITTFVIDPDSGTLPHAKFDLIFTNMVLHHVKDYKRVLEALFDRLEEGGYIAVSDLDKEDGSFHEDMSDTYHNGFDRKELIQFMSDTGYRDLRDFTAFTMRRERGGEERKYPVFMVVGRK